MNKYLKILVGLVFLLGPVYAWIVDWASFGTSALMFLKGGLMWMLLGIGLAFLAMGIGDLKE